MISKQVLLKYAEGVMTQIVKEDALDVAFRALNTDNQSMNFVCYEYSSSVDGILRDAMGDVAFENFMWWLFDCLDWSTFERKAELEIDGSKYDVSSFDKFYDLMLDGKGPQ